MPINWIDAQPFKRGLFGDGWRTPNSYGCEFAEAKNWPAVYLFLMHAKEKDTNFPDFDKAIVAYVGMSRRLKMRWKNHSVLNELDATDHYIQRWFFRVDKNDLREIEAELIRRFDPPWNIQGRPRGIAA
jgi:hypothetical protein